MLSLLPQYPSRHCHFRLVENLWNLDYTDIKGRNGFVYLLGSKLLQIEFYFNDLLDPTFAMGPKHG
jgi:hypothetical protein